MKYGTGVSDSTKSLPPKLTAAFVGLRADFAVNAIEALPPSPRQVHEGGRSEISQAIFPAARRQLPFCLPSTVVPVTARIFVPGPGNHVNLLTNPVALVFVTSRR